MRRVGVLVVAIIVVLIAGLVSTVAILADHQRSEKSTANVPLGAFLGSGAEGVDRVAAFEEWLGSKVTVGRTYLPGDNWTDIEGSPEIIMPWARWRRADPRRMLVINVPMVAPNEARLPGNMVAALLREGAGGEFDKHFEQLAARLVGAGVGDTVIVLGWEMNGDTYDGRCAPNPTLWKMFWRRIVATMRATHGARFRFDFAPARGLDVIPWTECYPGDDVVDIVGSDSYDQPAGEDFNDFIKEPYGLRAQADFAASHGKPISFPEWGLSDNSDNPEYVKRMHDWIASHNVAYQTITDYCPHGVWECHQNPRSSRTYRAFFGA